MKKKVLFVIPSLDAGGGEKSLISLLKQIDFNEYEVDLFLFSQKGIFINSLPKEVTILDLPSDYIQFSKTIVQSLKGFIRQGKIKLAVCRLLYTFLLLRTKNKAFAEQRAWKFLKNAFPLFKADYHAAVGFLEKSSIYLVVDKVKAFRKIGWIHTNYANSGMRKTIDNQFFSKLSSVVTVSEECVLALQKEFPYLEDKIHLIYNIVSPKLIKDLAKDCIEITLEEHKTKLITVARLSYEKGIDLAIEAMRILKQNRIGVIWYVIGDGVEKENLEQKVTDYGLSDDFQFLGLKENPYAWVEKADIYIQPSRYEGKSIAVDEAKILNKPIIVTNFASAKDQIHNNENGLIAEINAEAIAMTITKLAADEVLREKFKLTLSKENLGTESEIEKLYALLNE